MNRMALYKRREHVTHSTSAAFDVRHAPGTTAENPGIYRCTACGDEIVVGKGKPLPPQNHHQHEPGAGKVEWQMLVFAEQRK